MIKLTWKAVLLMSLAGCSTSGSSLTGPEEPTPSTDPGRLRPPGSCQMPDGPSAGRPCCILERESGPVQLSSRGVGEGLRSGRDAFIGEGGEAESRYRVSSNTGAWSLVPTVDCTTQLCVRANRPDDASM